MSEQQAPESQAVEFPAVNQEAPPSPEQDDNIQGQPRDDQGRFASSQEGGDPESAWTPEHFAWGQALSMSPEQVKGFGNPDQFRTWAETQYTARQQAAPPQPPQQLGGQQPTSSPFPVQPWQQQPQQYQQPQQPVGPPSDQFPVFPERAEDGDEFDPALVRYAQQSQQYIQGLQQQIAELKQQTQGFTTQWQQQQQQAEQQQLRQEFDSAVDTIDTTRYGRGSEVTDQQRFTRELLLNTAISIENEYINGGRPIPPISVLAAMAHQRIGSSLVGPEVAEMAQRSSARHAQAVERPGTQEGRDVFDQARQAAAQWFSEHPS